MPSVKIEPDAEEILVPEFIMSSASRKEASAQGAQRFSSSYPNENPRGEIHIQKKRQPAVSWVPDELEAWGAREHRKSLSITPEEAKVMSILTSGEHGDSSNPQTLRNTNISFRLHWSKSIRTSQPSVYHENPSDCATHELSREKSHRPLLPRRLPNGTAKDIRNSSLISMYNMADLVKIQYPRRYWLQLLIKYGAYTLLIVFVYFVLVGVPLWKGAVYWLYWVMQHKFVLSWGWIIAIALIILYVAICVYHRECHQWHMVTSLTHASLAGFPLHRS
jgi:hypothetical protein